MITSFPIIQKLDDNKKLNLLIKRDILSINKLQYIRGKIKQGQPWKQDNNCINLFPQSNKQAKDWINYAPSIKLSKFEHSNQTQKHMAKKSKEKLNRTFNRTKTDWEHNFIGGKYIQKIKQQLQLTKYHSFQFKTDSKGRNQTLCTLKLNQNSIQISKQPSFKYSLSMKGQSSLTQQQLERIRNIRQKRKIKSKNQFKPTKFENKILHDLKSKKCKKQDIQFQKFGPLQPWDDTPTDLTSMLQKRA